ncbi:hypothetical protein G4B88_030629 [Cannabis sativa]|uniref:CCHC-type domain-containing protein n=1 Tax=Cannabis sativa TaxID=3483 RepID=A0A7J6H7P5_CANSA|nr:hypothetical protein G4B88_030629 [Cannabis sativa]
MCEEKRYREIGVREDVSKEKVNNPFYYSLRAIRLSFPVVLSDLSFSQMEEMHAKEVSVDYIDVASTKLLERDSNMEMEMLELFEDITLEDVVINKACAGKVMGNKEMPASVVKKILMGVWRNIGSWRMKKCGEGVMGFFFASEEDCQFVMEKRPWLVNGVLLNLKSWPLEGEVQFHELPTRCLSNDNTPIIAKKTGVFIKSDEKPKFELVRRGYLRCWVDIWITHPFTAGFFLKAAGKEEAWIQFKYEKLPYLCFNCGRLAHLDKICHAPKAMVFPKAGNAVQMYGPWIKSDTGRNNCFTMEGKGITQWQIKDNGGIWGKRTSEKKGTWKRRNPNSDRKKEGLVVGDKTPATGTDNDSDAGMSNVDMAGTSSMRVATQGTNADTVPLDRVARVYSNPQNPIPIGPNYLDLPRPDFAQETEDRIPDIGPTITQALEIPHSRVCMSQTPHNYPDDNPIMWPTDNPELQEMFLKLYKPDVIDKFRAQQGLISNHPDLSELIIHLLGTRKRKAHTWYSPTPSPSKCSITEIGDNEAAPLPEEKDPFALEPNLKFNSGHVDDTAGATETKVSTEVMVEVLQRLCFGNQCCIPAVGIAGGFCIGWRVGIQLRMMEVYDSGFKAMVSSSLGTPPWALFCVYGPPYMALKQDFWNWLLLKIQEGSDPWMLMGDLNVILEASEKIGGRPFHSREGEILKEFLYNSGGIDLGCEGPLFTWQNSRKFTQHIRKRLDRAIADPQWCVSFPKAKVSHLPIYGSDHAPLLLMAWGDRERLHYPFWFLEVWTSSSECGETILKA